MGVLPRAFYARPAPEVARDLLGHEIVHRGPEGAIGGRIVEVEAYLGGLDPASHAFRGPTPRNQVMFGPAGHSYIYLSYGMHWCLNLVTEGEGVAGAVLVRALEPTRNLDLWRERRPDLALVLAASGPGRVGRGLGLDRRHNGLDLVRSELRVVASRELPSPWASGPRVGIRQAQDRLWRFWILGHPSVSRARGSAPGPWPGAVGSTEGALSHRGAPRPRAVDTRVRST